MNVKNEREVIGIDSADIKRTRRNYFLSSPFLLHVHRFDTLDEKDKFTKGKNSQLLTRKKKKRDNLNSPILIGVLC